jgi:hypothetical protein
MPSARLSLLNCFVASAPGSLTAATGEGGIVVFARGGLAVAACISDGQLEAVLAWLFFVLQTLSIGLIEPLVAMDVRAGHENGPVVTPFWDR